MILYHGTSAHKAKKIIKHGFSHNARATWKVKSKKGFVYLSLAYAPFYSMNGHNSTKGAIIKIEVDEKNLYPDDDFLMLAVKNKPVYTQEDLDLVNIEKYKDLFAASINYLGSACAKFEDVKIIGMREFDLTRLIIACDPSITPMNYKIMGEYYRGLTEALYNTGDWMQYMREYNMRVYGKN